ncbi:MAG: hypothetical protein GX256_00680 [Fretibacterium sp.]|nr:hypothetical protein [Fretibacterium sp.]
MREIDYDELLEYVYESDNLQEVKELLDQILEVEPDEPQALLLLADLTEDDEERLDILERAMNSARSYLDEEGVQESDFMEDELGLIYLALMQRMAFTLFALEEDERAFKLAEKLICYDLDDHGSGRSLYYRILLERKDWARVLEETMQDPDRKLAWAYSRLAAAFMTSRDGGELDEATLSKFLWEAVSLAPNAPFYMLGYFPEPEFEPEPFSDALNDVEEWEEEVFHFSILYEGVWSLSRELLNWFSQKVILFGLLTERFGEESSDMREILDSLGGTTEYEEVLGSLGEALDDEAVLRVLLSRA